MGQSAEELKYEIESTRTELGETLDAIGDRLSPGRVMERRRNRARASVRRFRERLMGTASEAGHQLMRPVRASMEAGSDGAAATATTVREVPERILEQTQGAPFAVGLLAGGVGFLLATVLPASDVEERAERRLVEQAEPLKEDLAQAGRETVEHLKEPAREAVEQVKEVAQEEAADVKEQAKQAASDVPDRATA